VFYEELVERPEAVARRLLSACGLAWEPGVLQFHDTARSVQTASMEQVNTMAAFLLMFAKEKRL
jgi:hypothetical protein